MVPEEENVSAFAVYSGKVSPSKSKKRRMKLKERKSLDLSLNKIDKLDIILKKKQKKDRILSSKSNTSELKSEEIEPSERKDTLLKKIMVTNTVPVVKKKKKKFQVADSESNMLKIPTLKSKKSKKVKKNAVPSSNGDAETRLASSSHTDLIRSNDNEDQGKKDDKSVSEDELKKRGKSDAKKQDFRKIKKLRIVEPPLKGFKKAVASTPKIKNKTEKIKKTDSSPLNESSSSVLLNVDQFLKEKKNLELVISSSHHSSGKETKSNTVLKLAEQAKAEILKQGSSEATGKVALEKILNPYSADMFVKEYWEKKPLHIIGKRRNKFSNLISTEHIDSVLRDNVVLFGKHLDVTVYSDGNRETHNMEGRAHAHIVWDFYANGCSVRLLNPQYFMNTVHTLNAALQEYFGCFVGANVYLTPPNSQGFAPHYDDIEAFILQVEGSKHWRIYPPISKEGYLPRFSSRNLTDAEIGQPIMDIKLSAGDVLYFPRGFIHQGRTEDEHSLHITLSVYQKTAWCDLLEKLLPMTLKNAAKQDVEYRKGLPLGYLKSGGFAYKEAPTRKQIVSKLKELVGRLSDYLETDAAMDQMGLSFMQDALPPVLNSYEAACSVTGGGWRMNKGQLTNQIEFSFDTSVRWIRACCYRILEDDVLLDDGSIEHQVRIYHTLDNSREYHKEEPQYIIVPPNMVPAVVYLASVYPKFTKISDLPGTNDDEKITLVGDLWDRGLLMTDSPLEVVNEVEVQKEPNEVLTKAEMEVIAELDEPRISENYEENSSDEGAQSDESTQSSGSLEADLNELP